MSQMSQGDGSLSQGDGSLAHFFHAICMKVRFFNWYEDDYWL